MGISPIVKAQWESLLKKGIKIDYYKIKGKGIVGYLSHVIPLRKLLKKKSYELIHAHYSFSAFIVSLTLTKIPIVVSLMGSDAFEKYFYKHLIKIFSLLFWKEVIVKSSQMKTQIGLKDAIIIPNGVNLKKFRIINKSIAKKKVNFNENKHIIFIANQTKFEKNIKLAEEAFSLIQDEKIELNIVFDKNGIDHNKIPYFINAADVLLLTSLWEGSPNVIKEAMACNCPIVSTDVGDVKMIISGTKGCYITSMSSEDIANKLTLALNFNGRTNGRENIAHLESSKIADKIIKIYNKMI